MKIYCNTSVWEPHFYWLVDDNGKFVSKQSWDDPQEDTEKILGFLKTHMPFFEKQEIKAFCSICGPGNFSSLRGMSVVLNTASFLKEIPIFTVSLDAICEKIKKQETFVFPSFGGRFWVFDKSKSNLKLFSKDDFEVFKKNKKIVQNFENVKNIETIFCDCFLDRAVDFFIPKYGIKAVS